MSFRLKIKKLFEVFGLLSIFYFFRRFFTLAHCREIFDGFIFYLYNYWVTNIPSNLLRVLYLRHVLKIQVGKGSFVHMGCLFYPNVKIGDNTVIGRECHLLGNITIGNNVSITAQTYIFSSSHYKDSPDFEAYTKPVVIEDFVWIGARAIVSPGVVMGKGSILGASSIATKNVSSYCVAVGVPAREIGKRNEELNYKLDYSPYFQ